MKKSTKDFKVGDTFKFTMPLPKGYLILRVINFEEDGTPWCEVKEAHYEEEAEDEYDEADRYKAGDDLPWVYTSEVELI